MAIAVLIGVTIGSAFATAVAMPNPVVPVVSGITSTTAELSISPAMNVFLNSRGTAAIAYFEYYETNQVCIAIYPTPEHCKPKLTTRGVLSTTITNLKPDTTYSVFLKNENTVRCVTTPCPGNEFVSSEVRFTTLATNSSPSHEIFYRNLHLGSRGNDVLALQTILHTKGYLTVTPSGFYGLKTRAAVRLYQRNDMGITPTGMVGPKTRAALNALDTVDTVSLDEERFTGNITAVSTGCFTDGECSVSVDGKKVVTTIGWTGGPVGTIKGTVTNIGDLESRIGANVNVYALKTTDGYTLYGSSDYYIEVL